MLKHSTTMMDLADYLAFALREMQTDIHSTKSEWCKPILSGRDDGYGLTLPGAQVRRIIVRAQEMFDDDF